MPKKATATSSLDDTLVELALPLPADVLVTLTRLIGLAYNDVMIETTGRRPDHMSLRIPHDSRCRTRTSAKKIRAAKEHLEDEHEAILKRFGPGGEMSLIAPQHLASTLIAGARTIFSDNPDAENYIEYDVYDKEDHQPYLVTVARGKNRTPHQLRLAADEARDKLQQRIDDVRALCDGADQPGAADILAILDRTA